MMSGLVNASFSLPEWQAVKMFSLHPESNFPLISPHFAVIFSPFPWLKKSLKFTPVTQIVVLLTLCRCHSINSFCYIGVKTLKLTLVNTKGNLILTCEMNRSCFIIKIPNYVTVSDEISQCALHHTQKRWEISNYQFLTWQIEFFNWPLKLEPLLTRIVCFLFPFRVWVTGVLLYVACWPCNWLITCCSWYILVSADATDSWQRLQSKLCCLLLTWREKMLTLNLSRCKARKVAG